MKHASIVCSTMRHILTPDAAATCSTILEKNKRPTVHSVTYALSVQHSSKVRLIWIRTSSTSLPTAALIALPNCKTRASVLKTSRRLSNNLLRKNASLTITGASDSMRKHNSTLSNEDFSHKSSTNFLRQKPPTAPTSAPPFPPHRYPYCVWKYYKDVS